MTYDTREGSMQLNPIGTYTITTSGGALVTNTLTLGAATMTTVPAFPWQAGKEQWFTPAGANLATLLAQTATLSFKLVHKSTSSPTPDATIVATGCSLANTKTHTFQTYAQAVLTQSSWISGVPTYGSQATYFVAQNWPKPDQAIRMIFDVAPNNPTKLAKIIWMTLDKNVSTYFNGVPDGTTYTLTKQALSTIPTNGWYYQAP